MTEIDAERAVVMAINSIDSCGATGLAADICTLAALGCHAAPITSAIHARDTQQLKDTGAITQTLLIEQLRAVLEDSPIRAIKLGDSGGIGNAEAIHTVLEQYRRLPLIFDPCWLPGDDPDLLDALRVLLLPRAEVVVLSAPQIHAFCDTADSHAACASELLDRGCRHVLITGTEHREGRECHQLFARNRPPREYTWHCLPERQQGVGSTVSAAIAAGVAHGATTEYSCEHALSYTEQCMHRAYRAGMGQPLPDRLLPQH